MGNSLVHFPSTLWGIPPEGQTHKEHTGLKSLLGFFVLVGFSDQALRSLIRRGERERWRGFVTVSGLSPVTQAPCFGLNSAFRAPPLPPGGDFSTQTPAQTCCTQIHD